MTKIKGNNVLITGGASGIGRIMGRIALERGAKSLIIWDINEASIASTIDATIRSESAFLNILILTS